MNHNIKRSVWLVSSIVIMMMGLNGCSGGDSVPSQEPTSSSMDDPVNSNTEVLPENIEDALDSAPSSLTQELKDSITFMYSEEGLAHDIYLNIYKIQSVSQLQNIATKSEVKHIEAVNQLAIKYDLNMTQYPDTDVPYSIANIGNGIYPIASLQDLYNELYDDGIISKQAALEVGCKVEVVDVKDLDRYISQAETSNAADVLEVFNFLRNGSYTHYWAFDSGLKNMGIDTGCCSLGQEWCHPEYPQK